MRAISVAISAVVLCGCPKDGGVLDELSISQGQTSAGTNATDGTGGTSGATTSGDPTGMPTSGAPTGAPTGDPTGTPAAGGVDVLFVIDNSGSMAEEQSRLAAAADALMSALAGRDVRMAFTTTDVGNPRCPAAAYTPEAGRFVLSSCLDRVNLGEFVFNSTDFASACTNRCALDDGSLPITPTSTASDPTMMPRPWIESIGGSTNLPDGVTLAQAFQCFAPQGVAGCGFESPLEAVRLALGRMTMPDQREYGFLRDEADLLIVIVTDEMDCSASQIGGEIFTTNKVYWNDPADPAPTSAVCWRAGVHCVGDGPSYSSCAAADMGLDGSPSDAAGAVLRPVADYAALLSSLQASKVGDAKVYLRAIAGVPVGFESGDAQLVFEDGADPDYLFSFGIGPGCVLPDGQGGFTTQGVPPLRILDAQQLLGAPVVHSVCQEDYGGALAAIATP